MLLTVRDDEMDDLLDEVDDEEAAADEDLGRGDGVAHATGVIDALANLTKEERVVER